MVDSRLFIHCIISFFILLLSLTIISSLRPLASVLNRASTFSSLLHYYSPPPPLFSTHISPLFFLSSFSSFITGSSSSTASSSLPPQPIASMTDEQKQHLELATFAAGCFWSVELIFQREPGVDDTIVGYTGGQVDHPTYEQVCSGKTGHAESVQITYDPKVVSYDRLLDIFFHKHDPTTKDRQGGDRGTQYRSAIFYHTPQQQAAALKKKDEIQKSYKSPLVTEIVPAVKFWRAEEYHQRYLEKGGQCANKGDKTDIRCYG